MATLNEMIAQGAQFNIPDPVAQYNKLAQMQQYQTQNALSQQEAIDKATERQRLVSDRTRRATFLTGLSAKLAEKGYTLDRSTLSSMMSSGIPDIEKLAFEGFKALSADEAYNAAMAKPAPAPAPTGGAPTPAPAPIAAAPTPAPAAVPRYDSTQPNVGAETFVSTGVGATNFNGTATRINPTTGEIEPVPLRENQAAAGLFDLKTKTYSPSFSTLTLTAPQIVTRLNNKLAALTDNPPEGMTPQTRAEMIAAVKEEIIAATERATLTPTNAMAPQAPAAANAMAPAPAPVAESAPTAAPPSELQVLLDQRNKLQRIRPQTPDDVARLNNTLNGIDKQIEVLNRQDLDAVRVARAIAATVAPLGTPKNLEAYNKALKEQTDKSKAEIVKVIGVATGTKNPVYLDVNTDEQYTYVTGTDGKQTRKLYSGGVDRSTTNVSQSVSNKVDSFIPASEAAQTEFMKEARVTYSALKNAQPTLDNIEAAKALIPTAKGFMGAGGEPLLAAASFLNNRLNTKIDTQGVTDANVLRSRLFFGILENLKKLDSQPSQSQQAALQEALGSLGTDPNALGRVLDAFGDSIRAKVDSHNTEMSDAETRGIKFPYNPRVVIKPKSGGNNNPHAGKTNEQIKKELGL
jgi:hypothetical protein